ncbi:MAG: HAMP domain-containing sensor histidine kinase [bacterium]
MRLPLFWKILLVTLPPLLAFAALGLTANYLALRAHDVGRRAHYLAQKESEAELGRRLIAISRAAVALLRADDVLLLQPGDEKSRNYRRLQRNLSRVATRTGARRIYVFDRQHQSLCDTASGVAIGARYYHLDVHRRLVRQVFENRGRSSMLFTGKDGVQYKTGFSALRSEQGKVIAVLAVEGSADTFANLGRLEAQLTSLREGLLSPLTVGLIVGIGLLLLVGASLLITRSVTRPVWRLVRAADVIARGDLEQPVKQLSKDELGVLALSMDRMRRELLARQQEMQLMLSGIAHEVRNPLGGMALFAGLLRDEVAEEPDRLEMVGRIQRELEYLNTVVNEFLDYARHTPLQLGEVDLLALLHDLAELLQGEAEKKRVALTVSGSSAVRLQADGEKVRRALLNIVRNAVQATPEGGTVTLSVRVQSTGALTATLSGAKREAVITCQDTGPGIPEGEVDKIFTAFYTTRERGTGLGLALAQKIVSAHGGRLEVESALGEGTAFWLVLPISQG